MLVNFLEFLSTEIKKKTINVLRVIDLQAVKYKYSYEESNFTLEYIQLKIIIKKHRLCLSY